MSDVWKGKKSVGSSGHLVLAGILGAAAALVSLPASAQSPVPARLSCGEAAWLLRLFDFSRIQRGRNLLGCFFRNDPFQLISRGTVMHSFRAFAVISAFGFLEISAATAQSQTAPPPTQQESPAPSVAAPSERPPTKALTPEESFGSIYGTQNLTNPPAGAVPQTPASPTPPRTLFLKPEMLQSAQDQRTQPPADISAYSSYVGTDALLSTLDALKSEPALDTSVPVLLAWNHVALDMTSIDHTTAGQKITVTGIPVPLPVFEPTYGEQFGPPRSSRAIAMIHLAMFEAVNVIDTRFVSYHPPGAAQDVRASILSSIGVTPNEQTASLSAAITQAAHDTLIALYPHKSPLIEASLLRVSILVQAQEAARSASAAASRIALGKAIGAAAAAAINLARKSDGSTEVSDPAKCNPTYPNQPQNTILPPPLCWEAYFPSSVPLPTDPLAWTIDPISTGPLKLGALLERCDPLRSRGPRIYAEAGHHHRWPDAPSAEGNRRSFQTEPG